MTDGPSEEITGWKGLASWVARLEQRLDVHERQFERISETLTDLRVGQAEAATAATTAAEESRKNTGQNRWIIGLIIAVASLVVASHAWTIQTISQTIPK